MKALSTIILLSFLLSGCETMKVTDTEGIKTMLENRYAAKYLADQIKDKYKGQDEGKVREPKKLYDEAYLTANSWVEGVQFDLQAKDTFSMSKKQYAEHVSGLAATRFITDAQKSLTSPNEDKKLDDNKNNDDKKEVSLIELASKATVPMSLGIDIATAAAMLANAIINNVNAENGKKVAAARQRIYQELEKAKWDKW